MRLEITLISLGLALASCSTDKPTTSGATGITQPSDVGDAGVADAAAPVACDIVVPTACPSPAPKYADVQPIFANQCGQCHGQDWTGQWPLDTYEHILDWSDDIRAEVASCAMPPADGGVTIPLADRMQILYWIRCGAPK